MQYNYKQLQNTKNIDNLINMYPELKIMIINLGKSESELNNLVSILSILQNELEETILTNEDLLKKYIESKIKYTTTKQNLIDYEEKYELNSNKNNENLHYKNNQQSKYFEHIKKKDKGNNVKIDDNNWKCIQCNFFNNFKSKICDKCHFINQKIWRCKNCKNCNDDNTSVCIKCTTIKEWKPKTKIFDIIEITERKKNHANEQNAINFATENINGVVYETNIDILMGKLFNNRLNRKISFQFKNVHKQEIEKFMKEKYNRKKCEKCYFRITVNIGDIFIFDTIKYESCYEAVNIKIYNSNSTLYYRCNGDCVCFP